MCNSILLLGTTTTCALKMFWNCVALVKDPEQVNFIKMRIQGIWDCPGQDQEVGAKYTNKIEMFQMTFREPMELIDEEARDLMDLENVSDFEHAHDSVDLIEDANDEKVEQTSDLVEPPLRDLLLD